jgi:hypothetical protein
MRNKSFYLFFLLCFLILAFTGFSKDRTVASSWIKPNLKIDGSDGDWQREKLNSEKKVKVDYMFQNDTEGLCALFIFNDFEFLSSIQATGMTLWVSKGKDKEKVFGVNYKTQQMTADQLIKDLEKKEGPLTKQKKEQIKSKPSYVIFKSDMINEKGEILTSDVLREGITPPSFRFRQEKERFVHEFWIPFRVFENLSADQKIEPGDVIRIGFEWGGMTKEMKKMMMRQAGSASTATGRLTTSDYPGDTRTPVKKGGGLSVKKPKKYEFWVDVQLAQKQ